jgi:hypothetical protein
VSVCLSTDWRSIRSNDEYFSITSLHSLNILICLDIEMLVVVQLVGGRWNVTISRPIQGSILPSNSIYVQRLFPIVWKPLKRAVLPRNPLRKLSDLYYPTFLELLLPRAQKDWRCGEKRVNYASVFILRGYLMTIVCFSSRQR